MTRSRTRLPVLNDLVGPPGPAAASTSPPSSKGFYGGKWHWFYFVQTNIYPYYVLSCKHWTARSSPNVNWHPLPIVLSAGRWAGMRFHVCFLCGFFNLWSGERPPVRPHVPREPRLRTLHAAPPPARALRLPVSHLFFKVHAPVGGKPTCKQL